MQPRNPSFQGKSSVYTAPTSASPTAPGKDKQGTRSLSQALVTGQGGTARSPNSPVSSRVANPGQPGMAGQQIGHKVAPAQPSPAARAKVKPLPLPGTMWSQGDRCEQQTHLAWALLTKPAGIQSDQQLPRQLLQVSQINFFRVFPTTAALLLAILHPICLSIP